MQPRLSVSLSVPSTNGSDPGFSPAIKQFCDLGQVMASSLPSAWHL